MLAVDWHMQSPLQAWSAMCGILQISCLRNAKRVARRGTKDLFDSRLTIVNGFKRYCALEGPSRVSGLGVVCILPYINRVTADILPFINCWVVADIFRIDYPDIICFP